jgi:predicted GNAT family acetyltransferase
MRSIAPLYTLDIGGRVSEVVNNESARRFEVTADGHTAYLEYARSRDRIDLLHTEVPKELGGRGLGGTLAHAALEYAKTAGLTVIPTCPFVKKYLEKNPGYSSLIAG